MYLHQMARGQYCSVQSLLGTLSEAWGGAYTTGTLPGPWGGGGCYYPGHGEGPTTGTLPGPWGGAYTTGTLPGPWGGAYTTGTLPGPWGGSYTTRGMGRGLYIEIHRIEMTSLSQRTAPGGQSRRVPL